MKKYKVEFETTTNYIVDVLAESDQEACDYATEHFANIKSENQEHYYQIGDTKEQIISVYDVSNTDDPFNLEN